MTQLGLLDAGSDRRVDLLSVDSCQDRWRVEVGEVFYLRGQVDHVLVCDNANDCEVACWCADQQLGAANRRTVFIPDPPYGIGYNQRAQGDRVSDTGKPLPARRADRELDLGDEFNVSWMLPWRDAFKPTAVYLFTTWAMLGRWKLAMELAGWAPKHRIVWDKMHFGTGDLSSYGDQLEDILVWHARHCGPQWAKREGNVWSEPRGVCLEGGQVGHPTPKPFGLYRRAVEHSTVAGDRVVDMFAGSGPAIIVGDGLRRHVVAVDLSPRYCALMLERCERYGIHVTHRARRRP